MRPEGALVLWLLAAAGLGAPLLLAIAGLFRREPPTAAEPWRWRRVAASALAYALAFNLVFFVQELFLVLPKAMTPGLHPVLFHNNHTWTGDNPLARLFQGTGALAIALLGLAAAAWLRARPPKGETLRLFVIWLAFCGLFESLPQVVAGAALPQNDVGMAMDYLGLDRTVRLTAALAALAAMAAAGLWLARIALAVTGDPISRRGRTAAVFQVATAPAALGTLLVLPFRAPGSWDQVVLVPVAVFLLGIAWVQAGAWGARPLGAPPRGPAVLPPLLAALAVNLLVFHLVLRPGVAF